MSEPPDLKPNDMSETMSEKMPDRMSGRMQDRLSEYMHICIYRKYINIHIIFTWQIVSQMICQKLFQNRCQIEWQKICEKI